MTKNEVIREIERAFENATMPRTEAELTTFNDIDAMAVIENFLGKSRDDFDSSNFLASVYMEDFSYMKQGAVEYYLPVVLKIMLAEPYDLDELWIYLHGFLRKDCFDEPSLKRFTRSQRNAISNWAAFLQTEWEKKEPWSWREIKEATDLVQRFTQS